MKKEVLSSQSKEYLKLRLFAKLLSQMSVNDTTYTVQDTYLDLGQDWRWTTIIAYAMNGDSWQALSPREWEDIVTAKSVVELARLAEEHFRGRFALDAAWEF